MSDLTATLARSVVLTECSIDGCTSPVKARGWCNMHWLRWTRHGDPRAGRAPNGEGARFFAEEVVGHSGNGCLIWPYGAGGAGYPQLRMNGEVRSVHVLACESRHGPAPTTDHHAAHSCGNGHVCCVNPQHLSWKTPAENGQDFSDHLAQRKSVLGVTSRGEVKSQRKEVRKLIDDVSDLYQNDDHLARRVAIAALEQDRPAYWTRFGYSAQRACLLQLGANGMPLRRALRRAYNVSGDWIAALDTLVPLNDQAVIAMVAEYADLGTFRDADELIARRERRAA